MSLQVIMGRNIHIGGDARGAPPGPAPGTLTTRALGNSQHEPSEAEPVTPNPRHVPSTTAKGESNLEPLPAFHGRDVMGGHSSPGREELQRRHFPTSTSSTAPEGHATTRSHSHQHNTPLLQSGYVGLSRAEGDGFGADYSNSAGSRTAVNGSDSTIGLLQGWHAILINLDDDILAEAGIRVTRPPPASRTGSQDPNAEVGLKSPTSDQLHDD